LLNLHARSDALLSAGTSAMMIKVKNMLSFLVLSFGISEWLFAQTFGANNGFHLH